jgi:hypothetical protein
MGADDDGLRVSVSALKEFLICPRRYQLHRVLGIAPAFVPVPLALGSAVHVGIAATYAHGTGPATGRDPPDLPRRVVRRDDRPDPAQARR